MAFDSPRDIFFQVSESLRYYIEALHESGVSGLPRTMASKMVEAENRRSGEPEDVELVSSSSAPRFPSPEASLAPPTRMIPAAMTAQTGDL
ncbi:MAG: hypothetical protein AB7P69_28700, partial [Candidatus Binatia bacterium]